MKPGWSPFPVRPVANESGLWTAHLHCGNHPEPSSPFSLPILSSLLLSNSCLRFVFQILFPILPLWSSQLILVSSVEPENSPRVFPHILPTPFPSPLCSPCLCSSPTQNTNADINSFGRFPRYIYSRSLKAERWALYTKRKDGGPSGMEWVTNRKVHSQEMRSRQSLHGTRWRNFCTDSWRWEINGSHSLLSCPISWLGWLHLHLVLAGELSRTAYSTSYFTHLSSYPGRQPSISSLYHHLK